LQQRYAEIQQLHGEVLAISTESLENQQALKEELQLTYPVLHDGEAAVAPRYGGLREGTTVQNPATFVVDRNGRIAFRFIGHGSAEDPLTDQVLAVLRRLEGVDG
jgi:peroxiredoxin